MGGFCKGSGVSTVCTGFRQVVEKRGVGEVYGVREAKGNFFGRMDGFVEISAGSHSIYRVYFWKMELR